MKREKSQNKPFGLLPPKIIALIGTPLGSSHAGSIIGHCLAGQQNLQEMTLLGENKHTHTQYLSYTLL